MHGLEERATNELERLGLDWEVSDEDDKFKRGKKGKRSGLSKRSTDIVKSPQNGNRSHFVSYLCIMLFERWHEIIAS